MIKRILGILGIAIILLIAFILFNTFRFSHPFPAKPSLLQPAIHVSAVAHMQGSDPH
jgi:hypothetical protein